MRSTPPSPRPSPTERPSLVIVRSNIGYGSPVQDTAKAHGAPLGRGQRRPRPATKLGWRYPPFAIPDAVYAHWHGLVAERAGTAPDWSERFARLPRGGARARRPSSTG